MTRSLQEAGNPFGSHRVLDPPGALPQPARKLDNTMERIWDNEILVDVETLNVDAASFAQIAGQAGGDEGKIKEIILGFVAERGKLQNPVTGSGGMFIGTVRRTGSRPARQDLAPGDRIASLVSLSLTPLKIHEIHRVNLKNGQVDIRGQAILFESGVYARMPTDMPAKVVLAALDVCGAPLQTFRLTSPGDLVVIVGVTGKSGLLCAHAARARVGKHGRIIGIGQSESKLKRVEELELCDTLLRFSATDALRCHREIEAVTSRRMADLVINCVNVPDTEMGSILMCRDRGTVYFFSMATSFTKAALGAEGVGRDLNMIIGNGYAAGHAAYTLEILRDSDPLRQAFTSLFC